MLVWTGWTPRRGRCVFQWWIKADFIQTVSKPHAYCVFFTRSRLWMKAWIRCEKYLLCYSELKSIINCIPRQIMMSYQKQLSLCLYQVNPSVSMWEPVRPSVTLQMVPRGKLGQRRTVSSTQDEGRLRASDLSGHGEGLWSLHRTAVCFIHIRESFTPTLRLRRIYRTQVIPYFMTAPWTVKSQL